MSVAITAIILTLNEAEHLPGCLESLVPLTTDLIVLDSGSSDDTVRIAEAAGARVEQRAFDGYANQRNAALSLPNLNPWVVFIDADERLTPAGAQEIRRVLSRADTRLAVLMLPRHNIFFGHTLKGGGWWPDHQSRVLRLGRAHYDTGRQVHEFVRANGRRKALNEPLIHLNYASWREFRDKQRAYSRMLVRERGRALDALVPARKEYISAPLREFKRRFITLHGYRDRFLGLRLALAMAREEVWVRRRLRGSGHGDA